MKKVLGFMAVLGLLTACSPSVDDYVKDPDLLKKTLADCIQGNITGAECDKAGEAMKQKGSNIINNLTGN